MSNELNKTFAAISDIIDNNQLFLTQVAQNITDLEQRVEVLEVEVANIEDDITTIETDLDLQTNRIDNVEDDVSININEIFGNNFELT